MTQFSRISFPLKLLKFVFIFTLLNTSFVFAQEDGIAFEKYGVVEGLPEEFAASIIQDDQGFMWITTQNGLVKYDGYDFKVYKYDPDDSSSNSLKIRNLLGGLIKANDGKLWIGSPYRGIANFNPRTEKFTNFLFDPDKDQALPFESGMLNFEDAYGNIWLNNIDFDNDTGVICRIEAKTNKIFKYPVYTGVDWWSFFRKFGFVETTIDSSLWAMDKNNNFLKWNNVKDTFEIIFSAGSTLPGTSITDTIKRICPADNFVFLAGHNGLYLFDPSNQKISRSFTGAENDDNTIFTDDIIYAFEDYEEQIWIIHEAGKISIVNQENNEVTRYEYGLPPLDLGKSSDKAFLLHTLKNNKGIWLMNYSNPTTYFYYQFSTKSFIHYDGNFNYDNNQTNPGNRAKYFWFSEDKTGMLWLNARPNLYKQSPKSNQIELFLKKGGNPESLPSDTIFCLFEDSKKNLWIGTNQGLALYDTINGTFNTYHHDPLNPSSISNNDINSVFEDSNGSIWVSTNNGLNKFDKKTSKFKRILYDKVEKNNIHARPMEDYQGRIWVSVLKNGVYILDKQNGNIVKEFLPSGVEKHGLTSTAIGHIFQDSKNNIWLGDWNDDENGLFRLREKANRFEPYSSNNGLPNSIGSNEIMYIAEDKQYQLWIGTDGGLYTFDYETEGFKRHSEKHITSTSAYVFGENGSIWAATYSSSGLVWVVPETGEYKIFGEKEGLAHNDVAVRQEIVVDDYGKLWLPNQRGLSVFDPVKESFKNYTIKDGFQEYDRPYSVIKTFDGDIWIGGKHGLNRISPKKLLQQETSKPDVWITSVGILDNNYNTPDGDIFKQAISLTKDIQLNHEQKDLTFEFVGLHYLRPEDNLYSWKLENYDKDWTAPSRERKATYTNLPPGNYKFHVRASNADGVWNEEGAELNIRISPPWWKTIVAYIIYGILFILAIIIIDKRQRRRLREKEIAKTREKELAQAKEIEKAYTELKSTQEQLIHSEKMASLGELTAGIAHEIQNPLNFVNNFSEVSDELIVEMIEEMAIGDYKEASVIADDIKQNLEKINYHGKRASSIVKGMLEHSRTGNNEKQPTDINAMADEYIRLVYHGMRAKDNSFQADFEVDLDKNIKEISVVGQDIARVVLNLINNAFQACMERSHKMLANKTSGSQKIDYKPMVKISTRLLNNEVEVRITDNGNGIPNEILDKIFQPFFTTKPTGEGTGLGLSLSYDIITKGHGGELKVETKVGQGTEFIIQLPAGIS